MAPAAGRAGSSRSTCGCLARRRTRSASCTASCWRPAGCPGVPRRGRRPRGPAMAPGGDGGDGILVGAGRRARAARGRGAAGPDGRGAAGAPGAGAGAAGAGGAGGLAAGGAVPAGRRRVGRVGGAAGAGGGAPATTAGGLLGAGHGWLLGAGTGGLAADRLSGLFLLIAFGAATMVSLAFASWAAHTGPVRRGLGAGYALCLGAVAVVLTATDAFTLLFAWESVTVAFYLLAGFDRDRSGRPAAALVTFAFGKVSGT